MIASTLRARNEASGLGGHKQAVCNCLHHWRTTREEAIVLTGYTQVAYARGSLHNAPLALFLQPPARGFLARLPTKMPNR